LIIFVIKMKDSMNIVGNKGQALRVLPAVAAFTAYNIHACATISDGERNATLLRLKELKMQIPKKET
jgi:hypothetical protein